MRSPFRYFNSSPEVIRLAVMMYIRYPLSLRQVEDLLFERGIEFLLVHAPASPASSSRRSTLSIRTCGDPSVSSCVSASTGTWMVLAFV